MGQGFVIEVRRWMSDGPMDARSICCSNFNPFFDPLFVNMWIFL